MTRRERVLYALCHCSPDRVPIDLGGTESSGMTAAAYNNLKRHLGLPPGCRVFEPFQHVAVIEEEIRERFDVATCLVIPEPRRWRRSRLPDGTPCELPYKWRTAPGPEGTEEALDTAGNVIGRRAGSGHHFDPVNPPLADAESPADLAAHREAIRSFDWPGFADEDAGELADRVREICQACDGARVLNFQSHLLAAGQILRGYENFMTDLVLNPKLAEALLTELVEAYCERADMLFSALGPMIDVVLVNDDLGTQEGPMLSPDLYRRAIKPHQERLFDHLKEVSGAFLLLHSCGSVRYAIPDLIEIGVDALNPIQVSAAGMDSAELNREFGADIVFWGGGCDTQHVLSRGSVREVKEEVKRRIDDLSQVRGFVFCQVHNIQPEVPPENVVAMLDAAVEFGVY